ncbi:hypothetical protein Dimus_037788 [Dionaea muscipula]
MVVVLVDSLDAEHINSYNLNAATSAALLLLTSNFTEVCFCPPLSFFMEPASCFILCSCRKIFTLKSVLSLIWVISGCSLKRTNIRYTPFTRGFPSVTHVTNMRGS